MISDNEKNMRHHAMSIPVDALPRQLLAVRMITEVQVRQQDTTIAGPLAAL
jgi:hypothetical protein